MKYVFALLLCSFSFFVARAMDILQYKLEVVPQQERPRSYLVATQAYCINTITDQSIVNATIELDASQELLNITENAYKKHSKTNQKVSSNFQNLRERIKQGIRFREELFLRYQDKTNFEERRGLWPGHTLEKEKQANIEFCKLYDKKITEKMVEEVCMHSLYYFKRMYNTGAFNSVVWSDNQVLYDLVQAYESALYGKQSCVVIGKALLSLKIK